ncbi:Hsp70 family protein [Kribbella sp. NPDC026611]|uniref:Hsp70 family protein n=1 Tax=Kribbella sp. NPDC026611 TaxID=3154911 RepID=UPI0033E54655
MVGIDLGTTFSAVAVVDRSGRPEIVPNREGQRITPSVVMLQGETALVGAVAKRSAAIAPLDTVQFVKRAMGDPAWRFETSAGLQFRPEEISAVILRRLKEDAEQYLGEPVTDAVITVPAYFDDGARRATQDAGAIAGLKVHRVLNEPTAAALAYGAGRPMVGTILVYDLGGGTFDVTVMRIADGEFETIATSGDRNLGGFEWDNALMRLINERFQAAGGPDLLDDDTTEADLRDRAEWAKHALTMMPAARVVITAGGQSQTIEITRAEFEDVTSHLVSRTRDIAEMLIEDAGLVWSDIDRVLLAGGSTRMPAVASMVATMSRRVAESAVNPDEIVALGAAVQARVLASELSGGAVPRPEVNGMPISIRDVTSQGLGTLALAEGSTRMENFVIVPPNTPIPAASTNLFQTVDDGQTKLLVQVTQGDDHDPDYVKVIGERELVIPPYAAGAGVKVAFAYDIDQTVSIEVTDLTANRSLGTFEVSDVANMTPAQKFDATEKIRALEVS